MCCSVCMPPPQRQVSPSVSSPDLARHPTTGPFASQLPCLRFHSLSCKERGWVPLSHTGRLASCRPWQDLGVFCETNGPSPVEMAVVGDPLTVTPGSWQRLRRSSVLSRGPLCCVHRVEKSASARRQFASWPETCASSLRVPRPQRLRPQTWASSPSPYVSQRTGTSPRPGEGPASWLPHRWCLVQERMKDTSVASHHLSDKVSALSELAPGSISWPLFTSCLEHLHQTTQSERPH